MSLIATPDKTLAVPGQEQIAIGSGMANGKAAILFGINGQMRAVELDFEGAVSLANGLLSAAIEANKKAAQNGSILQAVGAREIAG